MKALDSFLAGIAVTLALLAAAYEFGRSAREATVLVSDGTAPAIAAAVMKPPLPPPPPPPKGVPAKPKSPTDGFDKFQHDNRSWA